MVIVLQMFTYKNDDTLIDLKEVCEKIKSKDIRTALKWCKKAGIPIVNQGKRQLTYRFLVDTELDKKIVQYFKIKYPTSWKEMYLFYHKNDTSGYVLSIEDQQLSS